MTNKKNSKKGFTLVEIIVVLVIIAIMAAFAIPAYTGFVERAKQSEVLASGRVILVAAQTAGQEYYALHGTLTAASAPQQTAILGLIQTYSGIAGTTPVFYTVTISPAGVVSAIVYTNGTYQATYSPTGGWTTAKAATPTATAVTIG